MKWLTKVHKSKTMMFNILIAVLSIVELNIGLFQAVLGDYYGVIFMLVAIINVILRTVTTQPISEK